ncbi:MAG: aspartate aminotransferase family protein, partial [Terriglobia bacterium]
MSTKDTLLTVDDALGASPKQVSAWFKKYFNPSLALTLEMAEFDAIYDRAEGSVVYSEGTAYKDFLGGYGAVGVGHNHPDVIAAVEKVKGRPNILQGSLQPLTAALAHNLAQVSPGKLEKSFFTNSGAEAVEGALKIVRAATGRKRIIYAENAFHGKTFGALSATGKKKYRTPFEPLVPGFEAVPFGDIEALESALAGSDVAAFIVEPIQGEAGVILPPSGYLSDCERVCRSYETLLIVDEIQTGLGRTGSMFACEDEDV